MHMPHCFVNHFVNLTDNHFVIFETWIFSGAAVHGPVALHKSATSPRRTERDTQRLGLTLLLQWCIFSSATLCQHDKPHQFQRKVPLLTQFVSKSKNLSTLTAAAVKSLACNDTQKWTFLTFQPGMIFTQTCAYYVLNSFARFIQSVHFVCFQLSNSNEFHAENWHILSNHAVFQIRLN